MLHVVQYDNMSEIGGEVGIKLVEVLGTVQLLNQAKEDKKKTPNSCRNDVTFEVRTK